MQKYQILPNILALVQWRRRLQRKKILGSAAISIFENPLVSCFRYFRILCCLALNLCVLFATLGLILSNCSLWRSPMKCVIFILWFRRNIDEKEVAFQKSWRLCGNQLARKVCRDFRVNWASINSSTMNGNNRYAQMLLKWITS